MSPQVKQAMLAVKRHQFVPDHLHKQAYANHPLPIGAGQTISQPFIVGLMTELLALKPHSRVLEIGTGSGYQTAVLAELASQVYTIEIIPSLAEQAESRLRELGYQNVFYRTGDGTVGWSRYAPFDAIIVTAAGVDIPETLKQQLQSGGRLVMPVGPEGAEQQLLVISRDADGRLSSRTTLPVRFVPITH